MRHYFFTLFAMLFLLVSSSLAQENETNKLTNINPVENSILEGFSKGDSILFNTSFDSICGGFHERIIENDTKNIIYDAFNSVKSDKGEWVLKFYEDVILQKGHEYTLLIEGHKVADSKSETTGSVQVKYIGDGQIQDDSDDDYEYSNIQFMNFTQKEGALLSDDRMHFIGVEYSGDVIIDKERSIIIDEYGVEHPFENFTNKPNEETGYTESEWFLWIPLEIMYQSTSHLTFRVFAKDKAGRAIKGTKGKGENSYNERTCRCEMGYPKLSITPSSGRCKILKQFAFSNDEMIEIKSAENEMLLKSSNDEIVASFKASDLEKDDNNKSFFYSLEQEIEAIGKYTLIVPEGTFIIGSKMLDNKQTYISYEIGDKIRLYGVESINPADGSEVESLSDIVITFEQRAEPYYFNINKITVTNEQGDTITYAYADKDDFRDDNRQCIIKLETPITTEGTYYVNIPEETFFLGEWGSQTSPKMTFEYKVLGVPDLAYDVIIETIPNEDETLERIKIYFNSYYWVGIEKQNHLNKDNHLDGYKGIVITDSLDNKVAEGLLTFGQFNSQLYVDSIQPKLPKGKYQLHIPSGILIFNETIYTKDLVYEIDFNPTTTMQSPVTARRDDKTRVYNTQGMLVREGKIDEVLNGLKGIFIINGKKIVLQ